MEGRTPSPRTLRLTLALGVVLSVGAIGLLRVSGRESIEQPAAASAVPRPTERPPISVALTVPSPDLPVVETPPAPPDTTTTTSTPPSDPVDHEGPTALPAQPSPPVVILYGDSLAYGARAYFEWEVRSRGWEPVLQVFPGTATCDWFDELEHDLVEHGPAMVVVAFSGNAMTECMIDPSTGAGYEGERHTEKYREDTARFARSIVDAGGFAVIASAPAAAHGGGASLPGVFVDIVDTTPGSIYIDAGTTIAPDGIYTPTMPCRPDEGPELGCEDGSIRVRADDGAHFCPIESRDDFGDCPVYASGARRYGELLASHAWVADLH